MAVTVKICGIREASVAEAAVKAGADYLGLVFWPQSSRRIVPGEARRLVATVPARWVAVFKDADWAEIAEVLQEVPVIGVQCHGSCPPGWIEAVHGLGLLAIATHQEEQGADIWLFDGPQAGSGRPWDWQLPRDGRTYWLAGGLTPDNVARVVRRLRPDGVDVSSGVERNGRKDPALIARFIEEAKSA
jgi:phosphoribosylanthranilate isomerase